MKRFILSILAAIIFALPLALTAQSYTAQSGVTFFVGQAATATATSAAVRLPNFSGTGTLNIVETGITGSPSGCTIVLKYVSNTGGTATSAMNTVSFTPATGNQQFNITPAIPSGDNYQATYACSSTYPTAGLINITFSPIPANVLTNPAGYGDPCKNPAAPTANASISVSSATTTQLVALSTGKSVYVCQFTIAGTTGGSVQLEYGTGTTCTTPTVLTGAISVTTASPISMGWGGALITAPAGNALCLVTAGTSTAVTGFVSYVQQ